MPNGEMTPGEMSRSLTRIEDSQKDMRGVFATRQELQGYRELADTEHKVMREDISGIRDGLRWAFRLGVSVIVANIFTVIVFFITNRPHVP